MLFERADGDDDAVQAGTGELLGTDATEPDGATEHGGSGTTVASEDITVLTTDMTFVRIDGDGEAIPISDKVKTKYTNLDDRQVPVDQEDLYQVYGGD